MTQRPPVVPCHYRLSKESWAEIVEAYRSGCTARELAVKWKVAPGSVYYHACRDGWSKKKNGDERARAHARAIEAAEQVVVEPRRQEQRTLRGLFDPALAEDPEAGDPAALARAATLASGRAMRGRLWAEARALAGLAESYARLGERSGRAVETLATMDLKLLFDAVFCDGPTLQDRFWIRSEDDPDRALKAEYWARRGGAIREGRDTHRILLGRIKLAETALAAAGLKVEVSREARLAAYEARLWGDLTDEAIDEACRGSDLPAGEGDHGADGEAVGQPVEG